MNSLVRTMGCVAFALSVVAVDLAGAENAQERRGIPPIPNSLAALGKAAMDTRTTALSAERRKSTERLPRLSGSPDNDGTPSPVRGASALALASNQSKSATDKIHHVYLMPSASEPFREGFVRVINHSDVTGEVRVDPIDDSGRRFDTITLTIDANETVHFNSGDLETGNEDKGLSGNTGSGEGDWRLELSSPLDIEVLAYIRTMDGFLTAMHDVAPEAGDLRRVAIFNPASNQDQVSRLRIVNPGNQTAAVMIRGMDDQGVPSAGEVGLSVAPGASRVISAEQLESGESNLANRLGDGSGKWRLEVESSRSIVVLSLLESATNHLTNLSTVSQEPDNGMHSVPLFPAAGDASGRQGFVRVINRSADYGEVTVQARDESGRDYDPLTLALGASEVAHFNSDDLEQGNPKKGLSGGTGAGEGDWRLVLTSDLDIEVLAYIRTEDGFLTAMHDMAPSTENGHRVAVFNPGSNRNQESLLRLTNAGDGMAEVKITGVDGNGVPGESEVSLSIAAGGSRTVYAWDLESGADGLTGAFGDGAGKWQLTVTSEVPLVVMSLLRSPTGHITNLSTVPLEQARSEVDGVGEVLLKVSFDATPAGDYTSSAFYSDWPDVEWVSGLGSGRAEVVVGSLAYSGRSLRLKYPAGTYGSRNQAIQARMRLPQNYEELYVSYRVRFSEDFDFVKGGKLPGLVGGEGNTGGNRPNGSDGWSGRMMWRRSGDAVQYVYHPDQPGIYGEDFRWDRRFVLGTWHTVEHRFVMNTPAMNDGVLQTWFDGRQALYVDDLRFRDVDSFAIDDFYISTFFGGGDDTWAPTKDEYITFDDFIVSTARIYP